MNKNNAISALILGSLLCFGLALLGYGIGHSLIEMKSMDRTVTVKGLAEQEVKANVAIWPIRFTEVDNDLTTLYQTVQTQTDKVISFLLKQGFTIDEISSSQPSIEDRQAQGYVDPNVKYRYAAKVTISIYTQRVDLLLESRQNMLELAKEGIAISNQDYNSRTEFLFTELNSVKPAMVQAATTNARQIADKFAQDSDSVLGKIKNASQGQFSISDRDSNTPYIKRVRVVSTLTYYLKD
ncbi:SIMPL domain-containing protein [Shewanella psychropiezotolerans]|uniref:SIMPL domain-containing protein n=1 Tax=Shewanella psychropiezotolerans TaxID=2593655 RepID=A0ABX5X0I5_9GAMM|nr:MULTISPECIES: SIMPL domain-containing protein [Shewanella]MPY21514.1 SIMPL domain-containing protein [Shewanella sp. YLB-07]MPY22301.1 SIMPL domain-containing protein [Shewanella sp. YLB-07]QDO84867.1 SIMPL domain-containing protein [Shewanella psychropiezotolerans]